MSRALKTIALTATISMVAVAAAQAGGSSTPNPTAATTTAPTTTAPATGTTYVPRFLMIYSR